MKVAIFLLMTVMAPVFSADEILAGDNEYFSGTLPPRWEVVRSGGKENQMMLTVYDRTGGGIGTNVCTLFFDWDGLDPNQYIFGQSTVVNGIKWIHTREGKWIGIKPGKKYIATMQLAPAVVAANPIYYSFLNSLEVK